MKISEAKVLAKNLRKKINYHNNKYYNQDNPEISDYEYDMLLKELEELEDEFPEIITETSPTQKVGGKVSSKFTPVKHSVPMESLHDSFSEDELISFDKRMRNIINDPEYIVEPKFDGLSVCLEYKNGIFVRGSTRGDGIVGEDITENLKTIKTLPMKINSSIPFIEVRGEVYMSKESFGKLLKSKELRGEKTFKNPRNAAAGSLRQKNSKITAKRDLDIFIFNIQQIKGKEISTHKEALDLLNDLGFQVPPFYNCFDSIDTAINEVKRIGNNREKFKFPIDGAVIKVNSFKHRELIGSTSKFPKWAEAFKYPPEEKETQLLNIEVNVGRTGVLTPIGIFEPILLSGTTVSRATLHNEDFIKEKDIRIGDTVVLRKAGEIIPEAVCVKKHKQNSIPFEMPKYCPSCSSLVIREEGQSAIRCENTNCPAQLLRHLIHFVSRDAMDIEGLGPSVLEVLMEHSLINSPVDLYKLTKQALLSLDRIAEKSAENILSAIEKSKSNDLYRLIYALGIRHVGVKASKILEQNFKSLDSLMSATKEELVTIGGFGDIIAESIVNYFSLEQTKEIIYELKNISVNTFSKKSENNKTKKLNNYTFVLTGTLKNYKRNEITSIIESLGGKVSSSVSKKTNYVLYGDEPGSKLLKANKLGVKTISEEEFFNLIK